MGVFKRYMQQQLAWNKFTLEHEDAPQFYLSCWQNSRSPLPLLCVRFVLFIGCVAIVTTSLSLRTDGNVSYWFLYMTNWGIILIMFATGLAFAVSARSYAKGPIDSSFGLPWYLKCYWAIYETAIAVAFFITIFYYALLYGFVDDTDGNMVLDVFVHAINSVIMLTLLMTSQHPTHLLHFIYPVAFALLYMAFSIVYYYSGGLNADGEPWIYPVLDWSNPGTTTALVFASAGGLVLLHCLVVAFSLLRDYLSRKFIGDFNIVTINA